MIPPVARAVIIALAASVGALLATGCGGSAKVTSDHLLAPTAAQVEYANAVNLREADVRGLPGLQHRIRKRDFGRLGPVEWRRCGGIKITAAAGSGTFSGHVSTPARRPPGPARPEARANILGTLSLLPIESVKSFVYFTPNPAAALTALNAGVSERIRRCVFDADAHDSLLARFNNYGRVSSLPSPLAGVPMVGQQVITPGLFGDEATFKERWFGFTVGSVVVVLEDYGEPTPLPSTTERRLLSILYNRAKAHALA